LCLKRIVEDCPPGANILGVTDVDLFVPVLTFVFGEAQVSGSLLRGMCVSCCANLMLPL
jgi:predicted Zn-dependent protease